MATSTPVTRSRVTYPASLKFSTFSYNTSGSGNTIITATASNLMRIWLIKWTVAGSVTVEFFSNTTSLTQTIYCITGQQYTLGDVLYLPSQTQGRAHCPLPVALEEDFKCTLGGATLITGQVWYEVATA